MTFTTPSFSPVQPPSRTPSAGIVRQPSFSPPYPHLLWISQTSPLNFLPHSLLYPIPQLQKAPPPGPQTTLARQPVGCLQIFPSSFVLPDQISQSHLQPSSRLLFVLCPYFKKTKQACPGGTLCFLSPVFPLRYLTNLHS